MSIVQALVMLAIFSASTMLTRALPFLLFPAGKPTPRYIAYLGKVLPFAISGMLIVYCLKDISVATTPHGLPELIAVAAVVAIYIRFKNSLAAIVSGTAIYMALVQAVFV